MKIDKNDVAAIVIDVQQKLLPAMYNHEDLIVKIEKLIKGLVINQVPIYATQQYTKGLGETVIEVSQLIPDFNYIEKTSFSCCDEPSFFSILGNSHKTQMIVCGIESHVCVLQTVEDLVSAGYTPFVVADCISSRNPLDKEYAIERMRKAGAIITTLESVLFELVRDAKAATFKEISALVR